MEITDPGPVGRLGRRLGALTSRLPRPTLTRRGGPEPRDFVSATVVLTGAASGIGEQMARQLAQEGAAYLILVDRDADRLEALTAALAATSDTTVEQHVVDLSVREEVVALGKRIMEAHATIDLLINNAGVTLFGAFEEMSLEDFMGVLDVNLHAPIALTHTLLPALLATPGSHIITMSSLFGLLAPPGQSAYATSKFGVRGFSESIGAELAGHGIGVTTVHPGGFATRIAQDARAAEGLSTAAYKNQQGFSRDRLKGDPAHAAELILRAARRRDSRLVVGVDARILEILPRVAPGQMRALMGLVEGLGDKDR